MPLGLHVCDYSASRTSRTLRYHLLISFARVQVTDPSFYVIEALDSTHATVLSMPKSAATWLVAAT